MNDPIAATADEILDRVPCAVLTTDGDDSISHVNRTFERWTGLDRDSVLRRSFSDLLDPGSRAYYATRFQDELYARGEVRSVSLRLVRADGEPLPVLVTAQVVEGGRGARFALVDATAREHLERELLAAKRAAEASEEAIGVLQAAASRFLAAVDEGQFADALAETARHAFAASDTAVAIYRDGGRVFEVASGHHLRPLLEAVRATRGPHPKALPLDQIITITDLEEAFGRSSEVGRTFREHRAVAFSTVSFGEGDDVLGAFVCLYGRPRHFDRTTIDLHHALARQAGLALSRLRLQDRLRSLAAVDQLTGIANRAAIDEHADRVLAKSRQTEQSMAVIFLDLDGFKRINDELGHAVGDTVLRGVAGRLAQAVRAGDLVGRFGGDEFMVVCEGATEQDAVAVAQRIADAVRRPFEGLPDEVVVTASIGVAAHDAARVDSESTQSLTRRADAAMYESKRAGRDRIVVDRG